MKKLLIIILLASGQKLMAQDTLLHKSTIDDLLLYVEHCKHDTVPTVIQVDRWTPHGIEKGSAIIYTPRQPSLSDFIIWFELKYGTDLIKRPGK